MKNRRHRLRQESQLQPTSRNADNEDEGDAWDSLVTKTLDQLVLACCSFPPSIVPVYEPLFKKALSLIKRQQQTQGQQSHNGAGKRSTMVACRFPETDSASDWERTAGSLVRNEDVLKQRSATTVDCLFYIAANLTQTAEEYDNSFETNCQRFIEALSEAVTRGAPTDNLDRFFRLCIHLKDAHGQYPIRHLVTRACLQILDHKTVSSNTTSWLLRFILGPADYILYHLESRLALIPKAQALKVDRQTFDDMETRALVERLARILKLAPQSFLAEQIRYRAYSYLERMCHDPVRWSKSNNILKEMPIVQWKLCLDKDPLLWILMDRHPEAFVHFWASMSLHGLECSPLEHREEKLMRQLNVECIGIPELLSTTLEQSLERAWREDRDSLMSMLSCEAGGQWTVVNELRDGMLQSANRVVKQNPRISRAPDVSFTLIKDMSILAQRLASVVVMSPLSILFRVMYMLTLCAHIAYGFIDCIDAEDQRLACNIQAICLDAWHHCLVRRYEPRWRPLEQGSSHTAVHSGQLQALSDFRRSVLLAMVFVVDLLPRFDDSTKVAAISNTEKMTAPDLFLRETFQALIPALEAALDWEQAAVARSEVIPESPTEDSSTNGPSRYKNTMFTHWLASLLIRQWTNESGLWDGTGMEITTERFQEFVSQLQYHSSFSTSSIWHYLDLSQ